MIAVLYSLLLLLLDRSVCSKSQTTAQNSLTLHNNHIYKIIIKEIINKLLDIDIHSHLRAFSNPAAKYREKHLFQDMPVHTRLLAATGL